MKSFTTGIKIAALTGSLRPDSFTSRALAVVVEEIRAKGIATELFDPRELDLDPPGLPSGRSEVTRFRDTISEATGVVLATPEYHGSYSSVIKLAIENLGFPSALAGKPVALLGVAAGQIGAVKSLEHLRSVCAHVGAIVLPGGVSVANVKKVFDEQGRCQDERVAERLRGLGGNLLDYIQTNLCPRLAMEAMVREE